MPALDRRRLLIVLAMLGNSVVPSLHGTAAPVSPSVQAGRGRFNLNVEETKLGLGNLAHTERTWHGGQKRNEVSGMPRLRGGLQCIDEWLWDESSSLEEMSDEDAITSEDSQQAEWGRFPPPEVVEKYEKLMEQGTDKLMENITAQIKQRKQEEKAGLPPPEERGELFVQLVPEWEKKMLERARRHLLRKATREKRLEEERKGIRPEPKQLNVTFTASGLPRGSIFDADGKVLQGELRRQRRELGA